MALLGKGALVIWHDPAPGIESDYNEWHSKEHMFERVGIPGFRRGQRAVAISGAPKYFNFYEVDDLATLTGQPYLDRLNDPTPWTRRITPHMNNNSRTLCKVTASFGAGGVPAFWTMILLSPATGREDALRAWLAEAVLPELVGARASFAPICSRASRPRAARRPWRRSCAAMRTSSSTG